MAEQEILSEIYDCLQNRLSVLFFIYDKKSGRITSANEYARSVFGGDILKKTIRDIFLDFGGVLPFDSFGAPGTERRMISVDTAHDLPETFQFLFRDSGERVVVFGEPDVSNYELLQKNLFLSNAELSNLTRELQKRNMELDRLNKLKNEFLGMAAHDLRNPIGNIANLSEFLLDDPESPSLSERQSLFISTIRDQSRFLSRLINDLLDISSIESGILMLERRRENIKILLERVLFLNKSFAARKQIDLVLLSCPEDTDLYIDPFKIEQVLNNLVDNAVKYSHPGSRIEIEAAPREGMFEILIRDQGIGIPEKDIPKLFKPFSRVADQGTGGEKSTGLGLAIAQRIVKAHGGVLGVESTQGRGTTFIISLPPDLPS